MKSILTILLLLQSFFIAPVNIKPIVPVGEAFQHSTTHSIEIANVIDDGGCSATAVGPHTLLTAGHCFIPSHSMKIDNEQAKIQSIDYDDNDHLLIQVDRTFTDYTPITITDLIPNDVVHMWGNPGHSRDVYRIGVVERSEDNLTWFLMPGQPGDSGSGIFNVKGQLVAVLSIGNTSGEVGGFDLGFTPTQIARIK